MVDIEKVNEWARKSCTRWNKNKFMRRFYRGKYQRVAEEWVRDSREYKKLKNQYAQGIYRPDTYPWPYRDDRFADWDESDAPDDRSLVTDPSGFTIRHATSYCAWKIREVIGYWPKMISAKRLLSKPVSTECWIQFLSEAGYVHVLEHGSAISAEHCYVGIESSEKEDKLVVWADLGEDSETHQAIVSSYVDSNYRRWEINSQDFTWILIK